MYKVLIAYDNAPTTGLHDFFESCGDAARQICFDYDMDYILTSPPNLNNSTICDNLSECQICFIAAHGDCDGIYNENGDDIVSIHTTNYQYSNKGFYCVACSCAQNLLPDLQRCGVIFFVGYNDIFIVRGNQEPFVLCALAGFRSMVSGMDIKQAKEYMLTTFDEQIAILDKYNPLAAMELLHDKEALVFDWNKI